MLGITSYGAYVPIHRLGRSEIDRVWSRAPLSGEKAIANYDEDSLTMAVAACRDCIRGFDPKKIDSFYFASTTFPYKEKQSAAVIARAIDVSRETFTMDIGNSLRGGMGAVRIAFDSLRANQKKEALVCSADMRLSYPNGSKEMEFGDGAAALQLGDTKVIASIDVMDTVNDEIIDLWRAPTDTFVRSWEDRFVREKGYSRVILDAVPKFLKKHSLTTKNFSKLVVNVPNRGVLTSIANGLGFDTKTQIQDSIYNSVGNTGTPLAMMLLVAALEEAKPGDRILWVSYGDGCDMSVLTVTEEIRNIERRGIKKHVASKLVLPSYEKYLRWRDILVTEPPARAPLETPSAVALWRDSKNGLALYGVKCDACGTPQYPAQRICIECRTKDRFTEYGFADKIGKVITFSQDNLATSIDPPSTICAVDFEGGGRIMCDMTDRDPQEVRVGMPVEMTFRRLRQVSGISDYWWKCQPLRCKD
ncbi:MAG: OB-fold domain-containing protein [Dehalococcoidia bacterium]